MEKTRIINCLYQPINDREEDTAVFVLEKIRSIFRSCKTVKQITGCRHNLIMIFRDRFPNHLDLVRLLSDEGSYRLDCILKEKIEGSDN